MHVAQGKPEIENSPFLELRHLGGSSANVLVWDATENGCLWVRWPNGAGVYVVHVFRDGRLFVRPQSRRPLLFRVVDLEAAREMWRVMTGRKTADGQ